MRENWVYLTEDILDYDSELEAPSPSGAVFVPFL
jgi:hypothetical protein